MRLIRFGEAGREAPGAELEDGARISTGALTAEYDEAFFAAGGLGELERWLERDAARAPRIDPSLRLGPPIARPSKIICIGLNFRDHAAESGMEVPAEPVIFFKSTTALSGPDDEVVVPRGGGKVDWEVELAVVIGARTSYVAEDAALGHVAGYALHNDYSERGFQLERGGQWVKGKSADTFAPLGPYLATPRVVGNPQALDMWLTVNGSVRQRSSTSNMAFGVAYLVSYVSQFMTLLPGDVISTGTPAGVALGMKPEPVYLRPGDVVELGIDRLGRQRQRVVPFAAPA